MSSLPTVKRLLAMVKKLEGPENLHRYALGFFCLSSFACQVKISGHCSAQKEVENMGTCLSVYILLHCQEMIWRTSKRSCYSVNYCQVLDYGHCTLAQGPNFISGGEGQMVSISLFHNLSPSLTPLCAWSQSWYILLGLLPQAFQRH